MAENRSVEVFHSYFKSSEQFDYYVLAGIAAIVAYVANGFTGELFTSVSYIVQIASTALLIAALFFGFKRVEIAVLMMQVNAIMLHAAETRGVFASHYNTNGPSGAMLNIETGDMIPNAHLPALIEQRKKEMEFRLKELEMRKRQANVYYHLRNWLFFIGFVGVVASKCLKPYFG